MNFNHLIVHICALALHTRGEASVFDFSVRILLNLCILSIILIVSTQTDDIIELLDPKLFEPGCSFLAHWLAFTDVMIGHHVDYIGILFMVTPWLVLPSLYQVSWMLYLPCYL